MNKNDDGINHAGQCESCGQFKRHRSGCPAAKRRGAKPKKARRLPASTVENLTEAAEPMMSGPRSKYRPKIRSPKSVLLTKKGHEKLDAEIRRTGYSISDYFEDLLHRFGDKIGKADPAGWDHHATTT